MRLAPDMDLTSQMISRTTSAMIIDDHRAFPVFRVPLGLLAQEGFVA